MEHTWTQDWFEPNVIHQGMVTCLQHYRCRACKEKIALPDTGIKPQAEGCSGFVVQVKEPWKCPMKRRDYEEKRDYPARSKKQRKG